MRHYFFTCLALFLFVGTSFGQSRESRFQQIETAKIAYISKELQLTPTEAQKFFPLYNEYRDEMRKIIFKRRGDGSSLKNRPGNELEFDSNVLACKKKYRKLFSTAIPPSKASRFFEVESEFREKLFKELENRSKHRR